VQPVSDANGSFGQVLDVAPALEHVPVAPLSNSVSGLVPGPDGATFATVEWLGQRHRYALYSARTGQPIGDPIEMEAPPSTSPELPAYSPDGRLVAFGSGKNGLELRDASSGSRLGERLATGSTFRAMAFSPDGLLVASGELDGTVRIWRAATARPVGKPWKHELAVRRLRFSPDGTRVLVAGGTPGGIKGFLRVWEIRDGQPQWPTIENFGEVHDAAFSPDRRTFATASLQCLLWDVSTGRQLSETSPVSPSLSVATAFSPDGKQVLALLLDDNSVRLFDVHTATATGPHLRHAAPIVQATFSPDGHLVLTCSTDRTARPWDATYGLPVGPVWTNLERTPTGAFAADGNTRYVSEDRNLVRWELPAPMEGTADRIRLAVESATRHALDEHGGVTLLFPVFSPESIREKRLILTPDHYEPVRKRLDELGGPPGHLRR
jgi:WD40 repeat protein